MPNSLAYYLAAVNVLTMVAFVLDHYHSDAPYRTLIDRALLALSIAGGALGAFVAVFLGRMKLGNPAFRIGIPLIFFMQLILVMLIF